VSIAGLPDLLGALCSSRHCLAEFAVICEQAGKSALTQARKTPPFDGVVCACSAFASFS